MSRFKFDKIFVLQCYSHMDNDTNYNLENKAAKTKNKKLFWLFLEFNFVK